MTEEEKALLCRRMSEKLLVFRTMLRLSQAELAKRIGVSRQTVVALETNKRPMSWSTFLSLLLVFSKNSSVEQLLRLYGIYTQELEQYLFAEKGDERPYLPEQIGNISERL